jgi:hypothetical protein
VGAPHKMLTASEACLPILRLLAESLSGAIGGEILESEYEMQDGHGSHLLFLSRHLLKLSNQASRPLVKARIRWTTLGTRYFKRQAEPSHGENPDEDEKADSISRSEKGDTLPHAVPFIRRFPGPV